MYRSFHSACLVSCLLAFNACVDVPEVSPNDTTIVPIDTTQKQPKPEYLVVNVDNIDEVRGQMILALYNSAGSFNKPEQAVAQVKVSVGDTQVSLRIEALAPGTYAFALFHDANENNSLDTGIFGIPQEGFAFSNNATETFGAPSWDQAKFTLPEKSYVVQTVHLIHY